MTTTLEPTRYDFRKPHRLADDIEYQLRAWQQAVLPLAMDRWTRELACDARWRSRALERARSSDLAKELAETDLCAELSLGDPPAATWIVFPRPLALALVSQMLGEALDQLPEDRSLTDVEASLMELAIQEVAESLLDGQPCDPPLAVAYQGWRRVPDFARVFPPTDPLTLVPFELSASFGQATFYWLLPQAGVLQLMARVSEGGPKDGHRSSPLAEVVRRIPLSVVVRLGRTNVDVADLVNLQPGDILVLDQRVQEPLWAEVGDAEKFRGWAGRVGQRQAFQIAHWVAPEKS
jgi:flagellar motor switch protein FliM